MPRLAPPRLPYSPPGVDPARWLGAWFALGAVVVLLLPASHWYHPVVGWLPYWLVGAPGLSLLLARRRSLVAALRAGWTRRAGAPARRRGAGARRVAATRNVSHPLPSARAA